MEMLNLILKPVITEKATAGEKEGKYQFFVRKDATKIEIRKTFKKLYGVDVAKVNMLWMPEKFKTGRSRLPVRKRFALKKVTITTKGRKTLDITKLKVK